MEIKEILDPTGQQNLLDGPGDSECAYPVSGRPARFTRTVGALKKVFPAALLSVLVAGALTAAVPAVPAYAAPTTLAITAYPENSTGVPMVAAAVTNHVLRGTSNAINMFLNGTLISECKSRECAVALSLTPGQTGIVTADVGPRGTVPYTADAIVSATATVVVIHHPIVCHGTTCT
jgi:hypothetical protein